MRSGRSTVDEYVQALIQSSKFGPQVVCQKTFAASPPHLAPHFGELSKSLVKCLASQGIDALYSHQAEAIKAVKSGQHVIVATPTSSGKSMIYNLPVFDAILADRKCRALYLFPLKALSQDQFKNIIQFNDLLPTDQRISNISAIYDGDTSSYARRKIRDNLPSIMITNPEMLHMAFLPYHHNWSHFFSHLKYIIIDEVHTYRGIFGSHVAWLLKRLKRVASFYGSTPVCIMSSATIGNPKEFAEKLIGEDVSVFCKSGGAQNRRNFTLINPWDSPAYTASQLLEAALKRGLRTIVYTQSRKMTELITLWTRPRLGGLADRLSSYRAGFLPEERREVEKKLSSGELLGVISTSALELGIDIGDLDICLLVGYPGSIMATSQRGGRVGRGGRESAVILIAGQDALDQYYMNNPQKFFDATAESAVLNPLNIKILKDQLVCAAAELPLSVEEEIVSSKRFQHALTELLHSTALLQSADALELYSSRKLPQRQVSLRGGGVTLSIINAENGLIMGEIDGSRALKECHEGAIYLHQANTWLVRKLDLEGHEIIVTEKRPSFYTRAMSSKNTTILSVDNHKNIFGCNLSFGKLRVTEKVTGFQKRNNGTNTLITTSQLDLPEQTLETEGFWLEVPEHLCRTHEQESLHFMGGLHALEHLMISVFPLLVLCDRNDVGGISCPHHEQTSGAAIFIYDGHSGGSGLAEEAFVKAAQLLEKSLEIVTVCGCDNGCPACVHSPKCGSGNRPIDKNSCITLLQGIMSGTHDSHITVPTVTSGNSISSTVGKPKQHDRERPQTGSPGQVVVSGLDVLPDRFGVFDLETKYSAQEVGGWHNADKMEISVGVVYDSMLDGCVSYRENEIDKLIDHLLDLPLIVGFNNKRFDNRVLQGYKDGYKIGKHPAVDILEVVASHLGYRLTLNNIAEQTLQIAKSGDGLQALEWYKNGRIDLLIKYCQKDVEITRDIFIFGIENGYILFRNKAGKNVRLPLKLDKAVCEAIQ